MTSIPHDLIAADGVGESQDPLDALDAELARARAQAPANAMPEADSLEALDALVAQRMAQNVESRRAADAKRRLIAGGRSREDIESDAAILAAWEAAHVWQPVANVAQFSQQRCKNCGEFHYHFLGYAIREDHRTDKTAQRWIATRDLKPDLPCEISLDHADVAACEACAEDIGFSWDTCYYRGPVPLDLFDRAPIPPAEPADTLDEPSNILPSLFSGADE